MAGAGKKTFTAGETLTASDVNTYLMEQSVMVFGGTAARSSAIPTPSEGMTSYRTDTQQIESYDGAEWRGMSGLQLVKKQTIGTGVSSVTVTGAFSATYDAYQIIVTGGSASVANGDINLQFGSTITSYAWSMLYAGYVNTPLAVGASNQASLRFIGTCDPNGNTMSATVVNPFLAKHTRVTSAFASGSFAGNTSGFLNDTTSYTAFNVLPNSGTLTGGTIYVYGYGT